MLSPRCAHIACMAPHGGMAPTHHVKELQPTRAGYISMVALSRRAMLRGEVPKTAFQRSGGELSMVEGVAEAYWPGRLPRHGLGQQGVWTLLELLRPGVSSCGHSRTGGRAWVLRSGVGWAMLSPGSRPRPGVGELALLA